MWGFQANHYSIFAGPAISSPKDRLASLGGGKKIQQDRSVTGIFANGNGRKIKETSNNQHA